MILQVIAMLINPIGLIFFSFFSLLFLLYLFARLFLSLHSFLRLFGKFKSYENTNMTSESSYWHIN